MFLVDPRCLRLIDALSHGFRWKPPGQNAVHTDVPRQVVKDQHSHIAEACHYFAIHVATASKGLYGSAPRQWRQPVPQGAWA